MPIEKNKGGRPKGSFGSDKVTPQITKAICDMLEIAVPAKYAAEANGIHEDTFHLWMRRGKEGIAPYQGFYQAVTRATAKAVPNMHVTAIKGGKGSSAAMWLLERRFYKEYGVRQKIEHIPGDPLSAMSDSELSEEIIAQRRKIAEFERIRQEKEALES